MPNRTHRKPTLAPKPQTPKPKLPPPIVPETLRLMPAAAEASFPRLSDDSLRLPVQYVNALRALPGPEGLLVYLFAVSHDAKNTHDKTSAPVAKILIPTGFVRPFLDLLGQQAATMGLLADVAEPAPEPTDPKATP